MVSSPMISSAKYLQIFIYNTPGVTREGMFPMLSFPDRAAELNFVRALVSRQSRRLPDEPYFVINNPQLLPDDVRRLHMHVSVEYNEDTGQEVISRRDNCFSIRENLELLLLQNIDNNSVENAGFSEVLRTFIRQ